MLGYTGSCIVDSEAKLMTNKANIKVTKLPLPWRLWLIITNEVERLGRGDQRDGTAAGKRRGTCTCAACSRLHWTEPFENATALRRARDSAEAHVTHSSLIDSEISLVIVSCK